MTPIDSPPIWRVRAEHEVDGYCPDWAQHYDADTHEPVCHIHMFQLATGYPVPGALPVLTVDFDEDDNVQIGLW